FACSNSKVSGMINLYLKGIFVDEASKVSDVIGDKEPSISKNSEENKKVEKRGMPAEIEAGKRIQDLILSDPEILKKYFSDYSLFYGPKDMIGGDFYMFKEFDDTIFVIVGDCTGHSLEGALATMTISTLINQYVKSSFSYPQSILNNVIADLENLNKSERKISYGIHAELAVIKYKKGSKLMTCSTNGLPLVKVCGEEEEFFKVKKKMSVKENESVVQEFLISVEKGDYILAYSDGMPDQFGKNDMKKLNHKGVIQLFRKYGGDSIGEHWFDWRGETAQTDDAVFLSIGI
ncbi:MAG: SpoIIE family protein phosphatase, partial [Cyclobacteriaceae bacterium]|nr:SpoIIE family protein phosphatase [Cyclobacteriaceae bacterium]